MIDIQSKKNALRKLILNKRDTLTKSQILEASKEIFTSLLSCEQYKNATNICLYVPIRNEVDLFQYVHQMYLDQKRIWLPRIKNHEMEFYCYEYGVTKLIDGAYHIPEPDSLCKLNPNQQDSCLIIMPGAVFSKSNDRIGYGGGYYDRYLERYKNCMTVAVCYAFQIISDFPTEQTDVKPDMILSSNCI